MYNSGDTVITKGGFPINETTYKDGFRSDMELFWCKINGQFIDVRSTKEKLDQDKYPSKI